MSGTFNDLDDPENASEAAMGVPLLEVYSPLHEVWSGKIIAVAEFYEVATDLQRDLADARRKSWLLVAGVFLASGLALLGIVRAGSRTIERQKAELEAQIGESRELRRRAIDASARATAQAERSLRRVSADLHDGPAQYVALAAMRLDSLVPATEAGHREAAALGEALQTALTEIRALSRGLSLPELDRLPLAEVARRAVAAHLRPSGPPVELAWHGPAGSGRRRVRTGFCLYRFLQEALSNASRHAPGAPVRVEVEAGDGRLTATVADEGPGFDPGEMRPATDGSGLGLAGLRDRAESLGGALRIESAPGRGARLTLTLALANGGAR